VTYLFLLVLLLGKDDVDDNKRELSRRKRWRKTQHTATHTDAVNVRKKEGRKEGRKEEEEINE